MSPGKGDDHFQSTSHSLSNSDALLSPSHFIGGEIEAQITKSLWRWLSDRTLMLVGKPRPSSSIAANVSLCVLWRFYLQVTFSVCLAHMWNTACLQCGNEASILFTLCLSSLGVQEDVHSSGTPRTTAKDLLITDQEPQGSWLWVNLTLAVRGSWLKLCCPYVWCAVIYMIL